jgi:hypothetical protein
MGDRAPPLQQAGRASTNVPVQTEQDTPDLWRRQANQSTTAASAAAAMHAGAAARRCKGVDILAVAVGQRRSVITSRPDEGFDLARLSASRSARHRARGRPSEVSHGKLEGLQWPGEVEQQAISNRTKTTRRAAERAMSKPRQGSWQELRVL